MAYGSDIISPRTSARNWRILSWMPFGTQPPCLHAIVAHQASLARAISRQASNTTSILSPRRRFR